MGAISVWREWGNNGDEIELVVEYEFTPTTLGCRYQRNGDPGWPDEPAEATVTAVRHGSTDILETLTLDQIHDLEDEIVEKEEDCDDDYMEDDDDWPERDDD